MEGDFMERDLTQGKIEKSILYSDDFREFITTIL